MSWAHKKLKSDFQKSKMMNSVKQDEFDIQQGLQSVWAITFGVLYLLVMSISIILYLLTVRAIAKNGRRENVTSLYTSFSSQLLWNMH